MPQLEMSRFMGVPSFLLFTLILFHILISYFFSLCVRLTIILELIIFSTVRKRNNFIFLISTIIYLKLNVFMIGLSYPLKIRSVFRISQFNYHQIKIFEFFIPCLILLPSLLGFQLLIGDIY